jgi:DNA-binding NarL/FixJ family response regulator
MSILLVDDHAVVRQGYVSLLRALLPAMDVREAATGEEALARVQEAVPNLVIMDFGCRGSVAWKRPAGCASVCRNCGCCFSACTMSCRWCARRWMQGRRVT